MKICYFLGIWEVKLKFTDNQQCAPHWVVVFCDFKPKPAETLNQCDSAEIRTFSAAVEANPAE